MKKYDVVSHTPVEDSETFLEYFLGNTQKEAELLYFKFADRLNYMAGSYSNWSGLDRGDFFGAGLTGLARAARDFDPDRGGKFDAYAMRLIKNAMNEHCRVYKGVITVPVYIRTAHTHIKNIKGLLEGYSVDPYYISESLHKGQLVDDVHLARKDWQRIATEFRKLKGVCKNYNIKYEALVAQAEYIPTEVSFDERMTQEEMHERDNRLIAAALMVSQLKDHMTDVELRIAEGIMSGQTYEEIGKDMGVTKARIRQILDGMKEKFTKLIREG